MSTTNRQRRRRSAIALSATFLLTLVAVPSVAADSTAQPLPFSQDWHDTSLITAFNDWSGVPGVVGHLGQDITTETGVDPQTLLTDSTVANDVNVIANIPPDTNIVNGGVGEFEVADPVVALQPDGIADAPYLLLNLRTTGFRDVAVSYLLRDMDDSMDDAVQPVALQYRAGSSGEWNNVPAGFVADATSGPLLATLVTPVNAILPLRRTTRPLSRCGSSPRMLSERTSGSASTTSRSRGRRSTRRRPSSRPRQAMAPPTSPAMRTCR